MPMPARRTPRTLLVIPVSLAVLVLAPIGLLRLLPTAAPSPSAMSPAQHALRSAAPTGSRSPIAPATDATRAFRRLLPLLVTRGKVPAAALLASDASGSRFARAGDGIARGDHFRAGSITKTFIATVVLQLSAEHRLSLSDSLDAHLPGLVRGAGNDGRRLTLRSLLTHTSGLYDFTDDTKGAVPLTPLQAVRIALAHPPTARGRFAYSNTNFILLGMVIRQVTGHSYATEAERRIINPLRLTGTSFPGARTSLPSPHGRAYSADGSDVTALDPRVAGAAGELVTTLAGLNRFYAALLAGDLLPPRQLREMLDTRTAHGQYGMGLYPVKLSCGTTVWGHDGHISGSYVRTAATVDGRRVLTFRVNTDGIQDPDLEPALLAAEFCPRTQ
ncbi:beta-lactamase family protein [Streptomyces sp. NBC_01340]|uniref:serine hydrolase domain-containing protein n=2 Tax=Streptomyces TaxID=1883 RepID=UPI00225204DA|nr:MULTISPECIES: serine hydrolase domain-containing protein [unclassified Streptomyces]MCX4456196.1 beta-lactamase family protein [Streptomyces sp. NBC_01719]MCX4495555.1 beta-lactamase family protein [Streptomyces sp. NBC_01728]WSI40509.1 beta-lactamase family protein [Streptomyces sp. NBC_01340]